MNDHRSSRWLVAAAALAVIGLAAFFRLHRIDTIPRGLFLDEAQNGLDALSILEGESLPVFVEVDSVKSRGREPMLHYLMAGVFFARGVSVESIRLTVALAGIVTVALFFLLGARWFGVPVAFVSAVLLAVSRWHVTMSRVGVRAVLTPLWILLTLLALHRFLRRRTLGSALLLGAVVGTGFYTYPAFWIVPAALVAVLLLIALYARERWRADDLGRGIVAVISFLAVTAPLIHYASTKPDSFFARAGDVSADLRTSDDRFAVLLDHLQRGLFMLHFRGDESPMYNLPGRPYLDPLTGIAFVAGLFVILKELPRRPVLYGALLCLWLLPLLPGAVTTAGAWGMRSIGAIPAVFLISGVGLVRMARRPVPWLATPRWVSAALLVAALVVVGTLNYRDYFREWANDPGVQGSYTADLVRFYDFCTDLARENDVYASPYVYSSPNVRFLEAEHSASLHLLDDVGDLVAGGHNGRGRVFVSDFAPLSSLIESIYPGHERIGRYSIWGRSRGVVLRVPADRLKTELSSEQSLEASHWISQMQAEFETMTRAW